MTAIGKLNKRVTIQQPDDVDDGGGGKTREWVDACTVWANVKPISSGERFRAGKVENPTTHRITIRKLDGLEEGHRIQYAGRTFTIKGFTDIDEAKRFFEIEAEEQT